MIIIGKNKYDIIYKFGNTTVHVVAPSIITEDEKQKIIKEYEQIGWEIWQEILGKEKGLEVNIE